MKRLPPPRLNTVVGKFYRMAATAFNERFCVIAAVTPQIMQCKLASYYPAGSSVEAATTQSRHHVSSKPGDSTAGQMCEMN